MDREMLDQIWREAERASGQHPIDFAFLIGVAAEVGSISWRDAASLALREPWGEAGRPLYLLEFVAELANTLSSKSILDPWVATPTTLAAAHEASGCARSCGLVWSDGMWEAARRIASLDWRHGDPLLLLRDLSHERFTLVLVAPPLGLRSSVDPERGDPPGRLELADLVLWRVAPLVDEGGYCCSTPVPPNPCPRPRFHLIVGGFPPAAAPAVIHTRLGRTGDQPSCTVES